MANELSYLISEKHLSEAVKEHARYTGWLGYHTHDSRRSSPGFPDWVLVRNSRLVFAELKTEDGRVTKPQQAWLAALGEVPCAETYVWRPSDLDSTIPLVLARKRAA
jgi:hypothetical protein